MTTPRHAPAPDALIRRELDPEPARRDAAGRLPPEPPPDRYGIALSGGGIRSATFNLGVLQALDGLGILRHFHYLSTVSGGGYLGGFWTRWRHARAVGSIPPAAPPESVFPRSGNDPDAPEAREVRHLREFSNFLAPNLGVFSFDTGRMLVSAISSAVPSLLVTLSVLTLALLAWLGVTGVLFGGIAGEAAWAPPLLLGALTLGTLAGFEWIWRRRREQAERADYWVAAGLVVVLTVGAWVWLRGAAPLDTALVAGERLPGAAGRVSGGAFPWLFLLAPGAAWGTAAMVLVVLRFVGSRAVTTPRARMLRAAFDRAQSRLLFLIAGWATATLLWIAGVVAAVAILEGPGALGATGLAGTAAALTLAFAKVQQMLGREPNRPFGSPLLARLRPLLPQILAYAVIALLVLCTVVGVVAVEMGGRLAVGGEPLLGLALLAGGITLAALFLFNPNEVGLHSFYRSRIVRAYLGAWDRDAKRKTEETDTDDLPLNAVHPATGTPFHLVCCAVNDVASPEPLRNLHRGAVSGVLSRLGWSVGDHWAEWPEAQRFVPTLGAAVTASGAAFNPLMGAKSVEFGPAVTFLMAAFNLRLGIWLPHPREARQRWHQRVLVGLPFFKELFGLASATGRDVHLSDGGHFENMAVYELIRRRCRVVVACDCGQDPDVRFDDLGNLVRRVREDFGAEITIDLSPLRPGPDGRARQPMVAGDIRYAGGDTGILLVLKPTLVGDEPADIGQYRSRNAIFPHETTGDQFYDAAQWEAYRRLGEHAARSAFEPLMQGLDPAGGAAMAGTLFSRARMEWLPEPAGFEERLPRMADRLAELDALLCRPGAETVLHEVYRELEDIGGRPARRAVPAQALVGSDGVVAPRSAGAAPAGLPDPADLAPSLELIRRVLLLMHEIYERETLERNWDHPLLLGTMNYFARWAYAPLFRLWWPLLGSLYPEPFTRFVERRFGLPAGGFAASEDRTREVDRDRPGFAMRSWLLEDGRQWPEGRAVVGFDLPLAYHGRRDGGAVEVIPFRVQAAQLIGDRVGEALLWSADDFYVPPGLWGTGVGSLFLQRLVRHGAPWKDTRWLAVCLSTGGVETGSLARETRLYRDAGFQVAERAGDALLLGASRVDPPPSLADRAGAGALWMACEVHPVPAPDRSRAAPVPA